MKSHFLGFWATHRSLSLRTGCSIIYTSNLFADCWPTTSKFICVFTIHKTRSTMRNERSRWLTDLCARSFRMCIQILRSTAYEQITGNDGKQIGISVSGSWGVQGNTLIVLWAIMSWCATHLTLYAPAAQPSHPFLVVAWSVLLLGRRLKLQEIRLQCWFRPILRWFL